MNETYGKWDGGERRGGEWVKGQCWSLQLRLPWMSRGNNPGLCVVVWDPKILQQGIGGRGKGMLLRVKLPFEAWHGEGYGGYLFTDSSLSLNSLRGASCTEYIHVSFFRVLIFWGHSR